jgi:hypothetical protein
MRSRILSLPPTKDSRPPYIFCTRASPGVNRKSAANCLARSFISELRSTIKIPAKGCSLAKRISEEPGEKGTTWMASDTVPLSSGTRSDPPGAASSVTRDAAAISACNLCAVGESVALMRPRSHRKPRPPRNKFSAARFA